VDPSPFVQLRELAVAARNRGLTFDEFWEEAVPSPKLRKRPGRKAKLDEDDGPPMPVGLPILGTPGDPGAVHWPADTLARKQSYAVVIELRDAWARAYDRIEPTRAERALGAIAEPEDVRRKRGSGLSLRG